VVVAVALVRMVEASFDEVVDVVSVGDGVVATALAVNVRPALVGGVAALGVELVDRQRVLVDVIAMRVVEVAVVEEVDVPVVDDLRVPASGAVDVLVGVVGVCACVHGRDGTPPGPAAPSRW
jgi:hypothetical protein